MRALSQLSNRTRWIAFFAFLLVLAITLSLFNSAYGFWQREDGDLPVYVRAGERMQAGEEIYRRDDARPFTYPPFLALVAVVGTWLPKDAQRAFWYCSMIGLLAVIFSIIQRTVSPLRGSRRSWPFWALLMLLCFRHINGVRSNQSNDLIIVLLVALCAVAAGRRREAASGASAALGAAIKATPLLFLPAFIGQRRWVATGALVATLLVSTLLPDVVCPRRDGRLWASAWAGTFLIDVEVGGAVSRGGPVWNPASVLNQGLAATIHRLSTPVEPDANRKKGSMTFDGSVVTLGRTARKAVTLAAQFMVLVALAFALWPTRAHGLGAADFAWRRWGEAGAVACGMVLLSPMSSKSHFSILVLPVSYLLGHFLYVRRDLGVLACLVTVFVTGVGTSRFFLGKEPAKWVLAYGPVTWCAVATLAGVVYLLTSRRLSE